MPTFNDIPLLVQRQADLDQLCELIGNQSEIAVDTEFVRTNTYAPNLGLIQIAIDDRTACVDPLADLQLEQLWELVFDDQRTSIIHSGKQDMEVLWFTCGRVIPKLIDTQVCAALLGFPAQIGYAGLSAELLGIEIPKSQTRTDWSRRPLTDAQLHYAAEDVEHLTTIHAQLKKRLDEQNRYDWAVEDSLALADISLYKPAPDLAWQRLKSIPFLRPAEQARARALAAWREQRAVDADKPRSWILSDKALLQIAQQNPQQVNDLRAVNDLPPAVIRKQGDRLIDLLVKTNQAVNSGELNYTQEFPNPEQDRVRVRKYSALIKTEAERLGIAAEIIGSKRDIQAFMKDPDSCRLTSGWRREVVGEKLLALSAEI